MRANPKILLVEDEVEVAAALHQALEVTGYAVQTAHRAEHGLAIAQQGDFDAVVTDLDLQMPGSSGLEVVESLHSTNPHLPVILMTAHHTSQAAIAATKLGAYEYLLKPFKTGELVELIERAVKSKRLMTEPVEVGEIESTQDAIIGKSRAMMEVYKVIGLVAARPVSVLIRGETGTGKELVARYIYQHSERAERALIVVNCPAIPENLLESELFGHEAGAFTGATTRRIGRFEQANQGTIFLDEIGDISLGTQAKLLRVLQEKTVQRVGGKETINVDVRVIAATHRELERAVAEKKFREDLYYRLNDAMIRLPSLRERREDIPDLVRYFLRRHGDELAATNATITADALRILQYRSWTGNVRELRNLVHQAVVLAHGYTIDAEIIRKALDQTSLLRRSDLKRTLQTYVAELLESADHDGRGNVSAALTEWVERELYGQAIRLAKGDQTQVSKWLGVSRPTARERLLRYGLHPVSNGDPAS